MGISVEASRTRTKIAGDFVSATSDRAEAGVDAKVRSAAIARGARSFRGRT